ncbi:type IV secretory system conjugative DNA transfer family protein [Lysinibacillus xylanilyticus]|uniref:type IV secretory system conjugative DNA transfer family protein n=1 Tax=Lysinibacillus xylanilyticus TaxID=582475 RepID=UPI003829ED27
MSEATKKKWKKRIPAITVNTLAIITLYFNLWGWIKVLSLGVSHYKGKEIYYLPLLVGQYNGVHFLWIPIVAIVSIVGWLLSTRVIKYKKKYHRIFFFFNVVLANAAFAIGYGMTKIQNHVLPFFYERIGRVIKTDEAIEQALFSKTQGFFFMLEMAPLIIVGFIGMFVVTKYRQQDKELSDAFFKFQWHGERQRKFENLGKIEDAITALPDVELGLSVKRKEMVVLPGNDRTLNTIITGSIGTGKTAALGLPMIKQDLDSITHFINKFPEISKRDDYKTEEVQGRFMNGLTVVEPSNDLCKKVYQLAKAHGIKDEAITYIDPTNPDTPAINPMQGPTDKVAEVFTAVIAGLADNGGSKNFYFEQAQRNHLKHFIYLLKMHEPSLDVTFDMLIDMYNDTQRVHKMHIQLKKRFPDNFEQIDKVKYRDEYNYWQILKGIDEWFDKVVIPMEIKTQQGMMTLRNDNNEIIYIDALEQDVKGLRNILNDIASNILIRRVLFGKSTFNFDEHMGSAGGILLVNTAKGELSTLGSILGKIVLMTLQNAAFRRPPYISTYHHILVDEAPEYLYSDFASFPTQSRKFKVILTILQQTLTQLKGAFGEDYMNTVVTAMRNRMVYADVSSFDSKYFEGMFGDKTVYQEGQSEQTVSPLQENPVSRSGSSYSQVKEAALSSSEILFQEAFECAVKIVVDNKSMEVEKIKANFVPKEEFSKATVCVEPEAMAEWMLARYSDEYVRVTTEVIEGDITPLDTTLPDDIGDKAALLMQEKQGESNTDSLVKEDVGFAERPNQHSSIHYKVNDGTPIEEKKPIQFSNTNQNVITPRRQKVVTKDEVMPAEEQTVPPKQPRTIEFEEAKEADVKPLDTVTMPSREIKFNSESKSKDVAQVKEPVANTEPESEETIDMLPVDLNVSMNNQATETSANGLIEVSFSQPKEKKSTVEEIEIKQVGSTNIELNTASVQETTPEVTPIPEEVSDENSIEPPAEKKKVKKNVFLTAEYMNAEVGALEESLFEKATASVKE